MTTRFNDGFEEASSATNRSAAAEWSTLPRTLVMSETARIVKPGSETSSAEELEAVVASMRATSPSWLRTRSPMCTPLGSRGHGEVSGVGNLDGRRRAWGLRCLRCLPG